MDLTPMDDVNCGNFYDQIDDLIDYPLDKDCSNGGHVSSGDCKTFPSIWDGALPNAAEPLLLGTNGNLASDLTAEISAANEDILQLEWLSTFMEDSFSGGGMPLTMDIIKKIPLGPMDIVKQNYNGTQAVRRCQHCAITKTPQWRTGPMGRRTLCNACGVRYNSGRLFPEYRPAASPTFVPPLHSNSHRKVIKTRNKPVEEKSVDVTQRTRTKRRRSATFCPCMSVHLTSPNPPSHENHLIVLSGISSESGSVGESENGKKYHNPKAMEEKTKKIPLGPMDIKQNYNGTQAVRKCKHCAVTKTPQWRNGPMGPKTLYNACGVRYRSGRLFPEYRPAASPTFVPCLHSNSYRKVLEMRNKLVEEKSVDVTQHAWTKRPRSATFSPCTSVQVTSPDPPSHENNLIVLSGSSSESESVGESENGKKYHNPQAMEEKMKKLIAPKIPLGPVDTKQNNNGTRAIRSCQHCAKTKTPQWRNGPMGPKTLSNACGVCYKSERLLPEYPPAASPTFVPPLHSNSHRKVIEMRNKLVEEKSVDVTQHAWTKRRRSATFSSCTSVQLTSPNPPSHENNLIVLSGSSSESESVGESENGKKYHNLQALEEKMKKMIAPKTPLGPMDIKQNNNGTSS